MEVGALACSDLREPRALGTLQNFEGHARLQAITHRINAANASYAMQDTLLGSLGYALSYEKELDTTRYSFALSIPLGGTSRQKEQNRLEALHTTQSHREELSLLEIQTAHAIQTLSLKIETLVQEYKTMYEEIIPLSRELLDLEKLSTPKGRVLYWNIWMQDVLISPICYKGCKSNRNITRRFLHCIKKPTYRSRR